MRCPRGIHALDFQALLARPCLVVSSLGQTDVAVVVLHADVLQRRLADVEVQLLAVGLLLLWLIILLLLEGIDHELVVGLLFWRGLQQQGMEAADASRLDHHAVVQQLAEHDVGIQLLHL